MSNFFDIVTEQQKTEKVETYTLIGCDFLGDIKVKANSSYIFNLIISLSEELNDLSTMDDVKIDTDTLVDEIDITKAQSIKDKELMKEKVVKDIKLEVKKQMKEKVTNTKDYIKKLNKLEDEIYENYFFKIDGVPSKDEFFEKLLKFQGKEVNDENIKIFETVAMKNKLDFDGIKMNVYQANLYQIKKIIEASYGMAIEFSHETGVSNTNF